MKDANNVEFVTTKVPPDGGYGWVVASAMALNSVRTILANHRDLILFPLSVHLHSFEQLFRPHFQRHLRRVGPLGRRSLPDRQPPHRLRHADRTPERCPPQALRLSQNGGAGRGPLLRRHHLHFLRAELSLLHRGIRTGRVFVSTISLWQ
jgi:hypothetical protein